MKKAFILFFLVLCLAAIPTCDSGNDSSEPVQEVREAVLEVMKEFNVPGAMVGVWEGGFERMVLTEGYADTQAFCALRKEDMFRIASVTKTFTATVIMVLADDGALGLDDKLDQYLSEVPNANIITIRQLLNMTSGVYDIFYRDPDISWSYAHDPLRQWSKQELYDILITYPPAFAPGEKCEYSNANYFLLGLIAEQAGNVTLEELVRNKIIQPLGLSQTSFPLTDEMPRPSSRGYRDMLEGGGLEDITAVNPSLPWAGGAMISSLTDLGAWAAAMYNGDLLSQATQAQRLQFETMHGCLRYGLGIMDLCGFMGHNGEILGFANFTCYLPEKEAAIVVMVNKCNDDGSESPSLEIFKRVTKILYPDSVVW